MHQEEKNVALIREVAEHTPDRLDAIRGLFAEEFVWHYFNAGLPQLHGDFVGFEGFVDFFAQLSQLTGGTFDVQIGSLQPIGVELVVAHAYPAMVMDDFALETDAAVVWRIVDGQVAEAWDIPGLNGAPRPLPATRTLKPR
ncbi:MAG: nuclear transport factor 2 family protein [Acidobacteriota bacterium]